MPHYLQNQFLEEISNRIDDLGNLEEEELEEILEEGVEIHDPELHRINNMVGTSLHDTERREPLSVRVNLPDAIERSSTIAAGAAISDQLISGGVLLAIFTVIGLRKKYEIKPYQALAYGVGWELVGDKHTSIEKKDLISEIVDASVEIEVVEDMSREKAEDTLQELSQMKCIDMEEADGEVLVWFREEFNVEYSV